MIDTTKTITGVNVNGTSVPLAGGSGGGGGLQDYLDFRMNTTIEQPLYMFFGGAPDMTLSDLEALAGDLDTSSVTEFAGFFNGDTSLEEVPNWDFTGATDCNEMFGGCEALTNVSLNMPDLESAESMFFGCTSLVTADFSEGGTTLLTYTTSMFEGCESLTSVLLDGDSISNAEFMFEGCTSLNYLALTNMAVDFDISASTEFTASALADIIANLADVSGGDGATLTMGATNLAKLSQQDIDDASAKGWTLA